MTQSNPSKPAPKEFSGLRATLWPIHGYELKKFLPMALIMFCLLFNYTLLRDTKDTIVVNSAGAGAISFLKLYCVTPAAIAFVIIYAKISNMFSKENVFYVVVAPFLIFFGLFAYVIYPNLSALHPSAESVAQLQAAYPNLSGFIDLYAYWAYSIFYVLSEIWGSAMVALLFWQFANQVTRMSEAKRFYGLFLVVSNVALIFSGQVVKFCSQDIKNYFPDVADIWQVSLNFLMGFVVVMGLLCMFLYRWMHTNVLNDPLYYDEAEQAGKPKKKKPKLGLVESFKMIVTSPELGLIALLIMAYGVTINLVEVQWKAQLGQYFAGDKGSYNGFMGNFSSWSGVLTILCGWFLSSNILRNFSWFISAVITPVIIFAGGIVFFGFILAQDSMSALIGSMASSPVAAASFLGAAIVAISKSIKYSLFDPTKEMAYMPLNDELKSKGKAAVDVIGGRAGKAGGALVQSMLLIAMGTKDVVAIAPICFVTFAVVSVLWFISVKVLSKKVDAAVAAKAAEAAEAAAESSSAS